MYKSQRNWENVNLAVFETSQPYDIPVMQSCADCAVENWVGFNFARSCPPEERTEHGVHFYVDDYQFQRLWTNPTAYLPLLSSFGAVMQPDFSIYENFPFALRIWNVYRNAWLACFWQMHGIKVIPTVMWSTPESYDWCFLGYPTGGVVSVSSVGSLQTDESKALFIKGYREMMKRLKPDKIIFRGTVLPECEGNIVRIPAFHDEIRKRVEDNAKNTN